MDPIQHMLLFNTGEQTAASSHHTVLRIVHEKLATDSLGLDIQQTAGAEYAFQTCDELGI